MFPDPKKVVISTETMMFFVPNLPKPSYESFFTGLKWFWKVLLSTEASHKKNNNNNGLFFQASASILRSGLDYI